MSGRSSYDEDPFGDIPKKAKAAPGGDPFADIPQKTGTTPRPPAPSSADATAVQSPQQKSTAREGGVPFGRRLGQKLGAFATELYNHPFHTIAETGKAMVTAPIHSAVDAFISPVEGERRAESDYLRGKGIDPLPNVPYGGTITKENTPNAISSGQFHAALAQTVVNAAAPGIAGGVSRVAAPLVGKVAARVLGSAAVGGAAGAAYDLEDPAVGGTIGAGLGAALQGTGEAAAIGIRRLRGPIVEIPLNGGTSPEYRYSGLPIDPEVGTRAAQVARELAGKRPEGFPVSDAETKAAYGAIGKSIDFTGEQARLAKRGAAPNLATRIQRVTDAVANGLGPIERLGEATENSLAPGKNPRELLSYAKSSDHTVKTALFDGVIDPVSREIVAPSFKSLFEPFAGNSEKIRQALSYVKAKRDLGRGLKGVGGDEKALEDAAVVVRHGDATPELAQFGKQWGSFVDGLGNYAVKSGLWTSEFWDKLKASDALYVRYKRLRQPGVPARSFGPGGKQLVNVTPGVQRFQGSRLPIENPAEAMAEYAGAIIRRADRYRVGASLFDAARSMGPEGDLLLTPVPKAPAAMRGLAAREVIEQARSKGLDPEVLQGLTDTFDPQINAKNPIIWRNAADGSREYAQVQSGDLWKAVTHLNATNEGAVRDFLNLTLKPLKRVFTSATTGLNPRFFGATNPLRDIVDAHAKTQAGVTPVDVARGFYDAITGAFGIEGRATEAERAGLGGVSMFSQETNARAVAGRVAPTSAGDAIRSGLKRTATFPLRTLEKAGEVSDQGPRLGEYIATLRKYGHLVDEGKWTSADLRLKAATNARGVTLDFSNKPGNAVLRAIGDYVPFFNVALQAPFQYGLAAARNPARVASTAAAVAGAAATAWAMKHQLPDDVRQQINDRASTERAAFILVPLDDKGNLLRVPLGQEQGIIASGVTAALDRVFENDPHAGRLLAQSLNRALPPGLSELAQGNLTVPIPGVEQMLEIAKNKRDYGGQPIVPKRFEDLPPAERRFDTTNPTFDAIAAAGRKIGFDQFSPLEAEQLTRGIFSNSTAFLTRATDPVAEKVMGREATARVPIPAVNDPLNPASAVLARNPPNTTESERDYYALRQKAQEAQAFFDRSSAANDESALPRLRKQANLLHPVLQSGIEATDAVLNELRTEEASVKSAFAKGQISGERARSLIDGLKAERQRIYRKVLDIFRKENVLP